jgi:hypothetical protein
MPLDSPTTLKTGIQYTDVQNDIEQNFPPTPPNEFCLPCFLKGVAEGALFGLAALGVIALAPEAAILIAAIGIVGLIKLAHDWPTMTPAQKDEAVGQLLGGAIVGGIGEGMLPPRAPTTFELPIGPRMVTPEGVVVAQPVTVVVPAAPGAAGVGAAGAPHLMMQGGDGNTGGGQQSGQGSSEGGGTSGGGKPGPNENVPGSGPVETTTPQRPIDPGRVEELSPNAEQGNPRDLSQGLGGARYEAATGEKLTVSQTEGADFFDQNGNPVSLKGPLVNKATGEQVPVTDKMAKGLGKSVAGDLQNNTYTDKVIVDTQGMTPAQRQIVKDTIADDLAKRPAVKPKSIIFVE